MVAHIDGLLAAWPPFNRVADHALLQFVKPSRGAADA
jgi:hypothetical protein